MKKSLVALLLTLLGASAAFAADAPAAGQSNPIAAFFPLIIFVVIFYFFILRPQRKRQKSHDNLVNSLQRGDKVITAGGFFGIIREVKDDSVIIEIAEGLVARVLKSSISTRMNAESTKPAKAEKAEKAEKSEKAEKAEEPKADEAPKAE